MNEVEKANAYCFGLIKMCHEADAAELTMTQKNVTHLGKGIGSWEVTVRQLPDEGELLTEKQ